MPNETVLEKLTYVLSMNSDPLEKGARRAERSLKRLDSVAARLANFSIASAGIMQLGQRLFGFGASVVTAAVDMEKMRLALDTLTGSAAETEATLARLVEIAKLPGLGLPEIVMGITRLRSAGFSAELAEKAIKEFGNQLSSVGSGRQELSGVILALSQIASKGKIFAEELQQIQERMPQFSAILKRTFGTSVSEDLQKLGLSSAEFLQRITQEMSKAKRVLGGTANVFENLQDSLFSVRTRLGRIVLPQVTTFFEGLAGGLEFLSQHLEKTDEKLLRLSNSFKSAVEEFEATNTELEELRSRYEELREKLTAVGSESEEARKINTELSTVISALSAKVPALTAIWIQEKDAVKTLNEELDRSLKSRGAIIAQKFTEGLRGCLKRLDT